MVTPMKRVPGFVAVAFVALSLWFVLHAGWAGAQKAAVQFKGETMSVSLTNVSLEAVLEDIWKNHGIWYQTDVPLSGEKISLQFDALPVEKGFKRILGGMNHVLVFDAKKGDVIGLVIFGKKTPSTGGPAKMGSPLGPQPRMRAPRPPVQDRGPQGYSLPGPVEGTEEEVRFFESVEEAPPESELREDAVGEEEKPEREEEGPVERDTAEAPEEKEESAEQDREAEPSGESEKSE
jgi:hypothetical protein